MPLPLAAIAAAPMVGQVLNSAGVNGIPGVGEKTNRSTSSGSAIRDTISSAMAEATARGGQKDQRFTNNFNPGGGGNSFLMIGLGAAVVILAILFLKK